MASLRRPGAQAATPPPGRRPAATDPAAPAPLSLGRRLGVVVVVATLGASVLLAATSGGSSPAPTAPPVLPTPSPVPTVPSVTPTPVNPAVSPPTGKPVITPPDEAVLTEREIDLEVRIPDTGVPARSYLIQVYRDGEAAGEPQRARGPVTTVRRIALHRGENQIQVALVNDGGQGPLSEPVIVRVDDRAPALELRDPQDGAVISSPLVTVRGVSEPDLEVRVRNLTNGGEWTVTADARGVFTTEVTLAQGLNRLEFRVTDGAGNPQELAFSLTRGDGAPTGRVTVSRPSIRLAALPVSMDIAFELRDADGRLPDGVKVNFSVSVPGQDVQVHETTTIEGVAEWNGIVIPRDGTVAGEGRVTAEADLGELFDPVRATKPFAVE
jgi:hypothetical protein